MRSYKLLALLFTGFLLSSNAWAETKPTAKLTEVNGKVMINTGTTYEAAKVGQVLLPGHKIVSAGQSSAKVTYNDGCVVDVISDKIYMVETLGNCPVAAKTSTSTTTTAGVLDAGISPAMVAGTVLLVGGIVALANSDNDDGDISQATP